MHFQCDTAVVIHYANRVQALAIRHQHGLAELKEVDSVVREALQHFRHLKGSDPAVNRDAFRSWLEYMLDQAEETSQPIYREVIQYAIAVSDKLSAAGSET